MARSYLAGYLPLLFTSFANFSLEISPSYLASAIDFVWMIPKSIQEGDPTWQWFMCKILENFECKLSIRQTCETNSKTLI